MQLQSFVAGEWLSGSGEGVALRDATTGEVIARVDASGIDVQSMLEHARTVGGPRLRALSFPQRAALLKALAKYLSEHKEELYELSFATGATRADAWFNVDGGIGCLFAYASRGARELPDGRVLSDGALESLSRNGRFCGQHICTPLLGAAIQINAFNFPVWGLLEKLAPALLAGMPVIVKPASATAYVAERLFRRMIDATLLPPGAVQLLCGNAGALLEHLTCQDVISFTGSADTALQLRQHPQLLAHSVRVGCETDSLNSAILGPDAEPGGPEFSLFVREVVREMTVKAGQKCTAIRKALVPAARLGAACEALESALGQVVIGDPRLAQVGMGPLVSLVQRREVRERIGLLAREARYVTGGAGHLVPTGADAERGGFLAPTLLACGEPAAARSLHHIEAFGPVCTLLPYEQTEQAIELACAGGGSLVASVFTADEDCAGQLVQGLAPWHGRVLVVSRACAEESTGHGSPLPHLVHGGPGRAGGSEELGGLRAMQHYMQRTAVQGAPQSITRVTGRFARGARERDPGRHPFRMTFRELTIGDTFHSAARTVTVGDIEAFAELTGDRFYAHLDDEAAKRNPFFGGRVAHGYFLISAAAGLFVDPPFGPVLANYGIDSLRFVQPVKPGDAIRVRLTCKEKSLRADKGYGEVRWEAEIVNQGNAAVASYDVLTLVSEYAEPDRRA